MQKNASSFEYNPKDLVSRYKSAFIREQYFTSFIVLRVFAAVMIVVGISLLLLFNWPLSHGFFTAVDRGYLYRNYLYAVAVAVQIVVMIFFQYKQPKTPDGITNYHKILTLSEAIFLLSWAAAISSVDQLLHGDITVFTLGCFALAAATRFTPILYFVVYAVAFSIFMAGIALFQPIPDRMVAHYVNGTIMVLTAFVITVVLHSVALRGFIFRKAVELQKEEMELRVRERTADLALANEELKAEITERKAAEEKMTYFSMHDPLTGLYNRTFFEEEMRRLEDEKYSHVGLIMCDVDGLKLINDSMGHPKGDSLLIATANVIKGCFRTSDIVARVGGDEFAILLPHATKELMEETYNRLQESAENLNQSWHELPLSLSIGLAIRTDSSMTLTEVYKEADNNMYREKLYRSQSARSAIVGTLMKALEARDFITEGHAERLQSMVADLGIAIGLSNKSIVDLRLLAQFHDIGKVGLRDRILFKPGPLTLEEKLEMQRHCEVGHRIALASPDLMHIADWILKHHEWWNGNGYPLGLVGEEIPLECRVLAIADAYDAMTSDRPYRIAMTHEDAINELRKCAGSQFDPHLVDRFADLLHTHETGQTAQRKTV